MSSHPSSSLHRPRPGLVPLGLISAFYALAILSVGSPAPLSAQCDAGNGPGGVGPDMIASDLQALVSFGSANDFYAYGIGTTACNIGTTPAAWVGPTAAHPVIGSNLYRLSDGRLEQIGMSWLKHGFLAGHQDMCGCGCIDDGIGGNFDPGCSDVYSAAGNASQTTLGARSEVIDPANGVFLYPRVLNPFAVDVTTRRLHVHVDDIDPLLHPGARYFAESFYLAADESQAGNGFNNASVREVTFGSDPLQRTMQFLGQVRRERSVVEVWAEIDPAVVVTEHFDGEGGRLLLGARATEVAPGGPWRYEYVLANTNSTRAARSFAVPVAPGVVTSDHGFHDADYHSQEVWDGTDWALGVWSGWVGWQTRLASEDPLANAVRFATAYTFRFTADARPVATTAWLGYFEPGAPRAATIDTIGPSAVGDCDGDGLADTLALPAAADDCDANGIPDTCQDDCDGDGVPDICTLLATPQEDCDGNRILDSCQIAAGTSLDANGNGVPDECESMLQPFVRGDVNQDGAHDVADAIALLGYLFSGNPNDCPFALDSNGSGGLDIADGIHLLGYLFSGGASPAAPFPGCGVDPTGVGSLTCDAFAGCP